MAAIYRFEFTVCGRGEFPFDMLRYDACFPMTDGDASMLSVYPRGTIYKSTREVRLVSTVKEPTVGRWNSFGWGVGSVTKRRVN